MARDHARLDVRIWSDPDFVALSALAKLLYIQLVSHPTLTYAGMLDLTAKRWSRPHPDVDLAEIRAALSELDAAAFVVVDHDTEEVLIRTFIRNDQLYKQPNVLRAALRTAFEIESPILRAALGVELRRLPVEVTGSAPSITATALESGAHELPPEVKTAAKPRPAQLPASAPPGEPAQPPSEGPPNASSNPSRNPSARPLGEGSGETGEASLPLAGKKRGFPARGAHYARSSAEPAAAQHDADHSDTDTGSVRQRRRAEAARLVEFYGSSVPSKVRAQLITHVIELLRDGIGSGVIGAGLAAWSSKTLPPGFLPTLVGERMRADRITGTDRAKRAQDEEMVERFESLRAAAIAEDDQEGLGLAVRQAQPRHADAEALTAILDDAFGRAVA
ncbi:hypothetical protein [Amycolatopsis sp. cmx-4-54]|uniref:hypothetical protein n=1 Tax=Amycolatopsis sp. cmx-4-54 TaxID=2790936 RepID=UPI0039782A00